MTDAGPATRDRWVSSGAASLTGEPGGPGLIPPTGLLERMCALGDKAGVDVFAAIVERAAISGLARRGTISCSGASRLLRAADGWVAATLARPDDIDAIPAWLGLRSRPRDDPWSTVSPVVAGSPTSDVQAQGALLGLPVAAVPETPPTTPTDGDGLPVRWVELGSSSTERREPPLVIDLSSLWAGPLCARTLGQAGADVVKVESIGRPDGARLGPAAFFDRLHAGHRSVALDLSTDEGRRSLHLLVGAADVVIESSRPRALEQLGVRPHDLGPGGPAVWVSITGHGRSGPARDRVGFGDDAAAGGGLVAPGPGGPVFVADAVADPLAGLAAAAAAQAALARDGRWLVEVALAPVAAWVANGGVGEPWDEVGSPPYPGRVEHPHRPGPELGADTLAVLREVSAA